ncbi:hypothetical protein [Bacteroides luti]|uniref:hypothetical protein n=1 Tax=Bacteroides luti TaxID=1297750 RepID=UPI001FE85F08|nr:hypothetical protein [Bacteroides luti]
MQIKLQTIIPVAQVSKVGFDAKRNFNRNITQKTNANPTSEAAPAIVISSRLKEVEPTISLTTARYTPPESWKITAKTITIHGRNFSGIKLQIDGIEKGPVSCID